MTEQNACPECGMLPAVQLDDHTIGIPVENLRTLQPKE